MANKVIMPKQGLQMTEGNIIEWKKAEGEVVEEGEPLFEMETDKLTIDIDSPVSGTLLKIVRAAGEVVPITELIAVIGEPGEDISALLADAESVAAPAAPSAAPESTAPVMPQSVDTPSASEAASASAAQPAAVNELPDNGRVFATPRARMRAEEHEVELSTLAGSGPQGLIIERDVLEAIKNAPRASSLARKVAKQQGLTLDGIAGTGPQGRILRDDVLSVVGHSSGIGGATGSASIGEASLQSARKLPISGMRRVIARRMRESLDTAAQAVHRIEVDMTEVGRMRAKLKGLEIKVSYNDVIIKAVAGGLREHPRMNAIMTEDEIIEFSEINIGMAVAVEEGLLVPVLRSVDRMGLKEIHSESLRLGELARDGGLSTEDMQGGTFSVSNLGMYEIDSFTAVINSPESGILAVGAVKDRVVPENGEAVIRPMAHLSLTYDHRIIDGAPAASFLRTVKTLLENPYLLI